MFGDTSKRHRIYHWLDANLDKLDNSGNNDRLVITKNQLFILVEDYFYLNDYNEYTDERYTADDLNSFSFPIKFCEDFIKTHNTLKICFEDVFEAFERVKSIHPNYEQDKVVYDKVNMLEEMSGLSQPTSPSQTANDDITMLLYESSMEYYANFIKRYIDNDIIDFDFSICGKQYKNQTYNYINDVLNKRLYCCDEYYPKTIDMLWFNQIITHYSANPNQQIINDNKIVKHDMKYKDHEKLFNSLIKSNIINEYNYKSKLTVQEYLLHF